MSIKSATAVTLIGVVVVLMQSCDNDEPITWHQEMGYEWARLPVPRSGKTGFKALPESETGVTFSNNVTKDQIKHNRILLNGSGVALGDINADGLTDIYFCRLDGPNVLYQNLGGLKFVDITDSAGVGCPDQFSAGATFADIDGDTDLDLLVTSIGGPNACFLNDGTGKFTDITAAAGISYKGGPSSLTLADIEGDGDLDLYIANYKEKSAKDIWDAGELTFDFVVERVGNSQRIAPKYQDHFVLDIRGQWAFYFESGEPDALFLNDGQGHFDQVALTGGRFLDENGKPIQELKDWGLMARFQDMDSDGDPDIYVCNDFESPDRIWINDGKGYFEAIPPLAIRNTSNSSMSVGFSDIDRDGDQDFLVADMLSRDHVRRMRQKNTEIPLPLALGQIDNRPQYMKNTLFLNQGDKTYAEIAQFSGIQASDWTWSTIFLDVDLDGYEDVLTTTGHYYDAQNMDAMKKAEGRVMRSAVAARMAQQNGTKRAENDKLNVVFLFPKLELPNMAFRNRGDLTFEERGKPWGLASNDISHGMALGDLDNDGDLDVVINRLGMPALLHRNESKAGRVAVRLRGLTPNTQAIGAKIRVTGGPVPQSKEVICGGAYLSGSDQFYAFATGKSEDLRIEVEWRNGTISTISNVKPNHVYVISESGAHSRAAARLTKNSQLKPIFEDVSSLISHKHHEDEFDDFKRQPMLPNRLSSLGPGLAWYDYDADGDDDLIIASGKGGRAGLFQNEGAAGFRSMKDAALTAATEFDQTAVLGWTQQNGSRSLLFGNANFENFEKTRSFVQRYDLSARPRNQGERIPTDNSSIGPMAMADYDGDGDLDLLVGGRSVPGRYPAPSSAILYANENGELVPDSLASLPFRELGLISAVVFSDFDADGDADIIFAIEWGPVMLFQNEEGKFSDVTADFGLDQHHGRWQGVTTGDLDEDGKLDIIATNWGLNTKFEHRYSDEHPLELIYHDFDNNGRLDVVQAYFNTEYQALLPEANLFGMVRGLPFIRMRTPDHSKYSRSKLQEILGPKMLEARRLHANTLAHMVFFNRGDRFEPSQLPREAQFAPAFHVGVTDYDGDGHEDVFLSQNFFAMKVQAPRADAGRGLWLKGDGTGRLEAVPAQVSGIHVYGEQRGAAFSDYDGDGRVDLVVSQNSAETRLYHNVGAKPGLRVRLAGPKGNPDGVGTTIRLRYEHGLGPAREIHSGSGYWSQDSMVAVMGVREDLNGIWVRWPGGHITEQEIEPGETEIMIQFNGPTP